MALDLDDGYTLPFSTEPFARDEVSGRLIAEDLPVVSGRYRPATWEELQSFRWKLGRSTSGEDEVRIVSEFLASHVVAWDVLAKGQLLAVSAESVRRLPEVIGNQLLSIVSRWAPRQADEEGK